MGTGQVLNKRKSNVVESIRVLKKRKSTVIEPIRVLNKRKSTVMKKKNVKKKQSRRERYGNKCNRTHSSFEQAQDYCTKIKETKSTSTLR